MTNEDSTRLGLMLRLDMFPEHLRRIVEVCAAAYEPCTRSDLITCFRLLGIRYSERKAYDTARLTPVLEELAAADVLRWDGAVATCHPAITELILRRLSCDESRFAELADGVMSALPFAEERHSPSHHNYKRGLRDVRLALYRGDVENFIVYLKRLEGHFPKEFRERPPLPIILDNPLELEWLMALPGHIVDDGLVSLLHAREQSMRDTEAIIDEAEHRLEKTEASSSLRWTTVEHLIQRGQLARARALVADDDTLRGETCRGWILLLDGDREGAHKQLEAAMKRLRRETRRRKIAFEHTSGVLYPLLQLAQQDEASFKGAREYLETAIRQGSPHLAVIHRCLLVTTYALQGQLEDARIGWTSTTARTLRIAGLNALLYALTLLWFKGELAARELSKLEEAAESAKQSGYLWIAAEIAEVLARLGADGWTEKARAMRDELHVAPLADLIVREQPWERSLRLMLELGDEEGGVDDAPESTRRLVWFVKYYARAGEVTLEAREQVRQSRGTWSKGRKISLERLAESAETLEFLTPQDRKICAALESFVEAGAYGRYYGHRTVYRFDWERALPALIGHPHVFRADEPTKSVQVVRSRPELHVEQNGDRLRLFLKPSLKGSDQSVLVTEVDPSRLEVLQITERQRALAGILGPEGFDVPARGSDTVAQVIGSLASIVTISSDISAEMTRGEGREAETTPRVRLVPFEQGLKLDIGVRPLGQGTAVVVPGEGAPIMLDEVEGAQLQAERDLEGERRRADQLLESCPSLARADGAGWHRTLRDPLECLEALLELEDLGDDVILEWPEGKPFTIVHRPKTRRLRLDITGRRQWFEISGELTLDEGKVLELRHLLDLVAQSPGRFIELTPGQFMLLTESLQKQLRELSALSEKQERGVKVHQLTAGLLDELLAEAGTVQVDESWKANTARLEEMRSFEPVVPSTLKAELRDYQKDGYQWLARLAHWGAGACLADDMGLGKTVQTLSLLVARGELGPALVVAPTSVCAGWLDESFRFAPTLHAIDFRVGDRQRTLDAVGAFDVVVCSYTLLQNESERLTAVSWSTVVLDEGQAIKNPAAKRTKAAKSLAADARVVLTGTPIENRLSELWSIFSFLNPGLLGTLKHFKRRFATPIESDHDHDARRALKSLVQPFILRRTKAEVLTELPPKIEISRTVELSEEECALYEALRRRALERIQDSAEDGGAKHLQILAELTKLRRAACHPRLALPEAGLQGSKLESFAELVDDLLAGGHKALVFSQFVDHLRLIRERLDEMKVSYQYLDGSTPTKERAARVKSFQSGRGDLFLISLKAGGLGLNLTAADYVIHMDPWWNPAVEDQGSDRAHRMGQERPVTVYRLVSKGTIEERILELHRSKRDLAEQFLSGADMVGSMSAEELLELIKPR